MRIRLFIPIVLLAALWAAPAYAEPPAGVRVVTCDDGAASYAARMRPVPGTARMALRIHLLEKTGDGDYHRVAGNGLGVWRKSDPGAAAFQWTQRVEGLRPATAYRVAVRYRWLNADGEPIRAARGRSAACKQPGALPNLRVATIEVRPGDVDDTARYRVQIANRGGSEAHGVGVLLRVDGEVVDESEVIEVLEPGEVRTLSFNGPVCHRRVAAVVDPKDQIAESHEDDNIRSAACL